MTPASCATAASAVAATSVKILFWDAWAKASPPASLSITMRRWAIPPAYRAVSAWCPARRARSQTSSSRRLHIAKTADSEPVPLEVLQELPFFQGVSGTFLSLNRNAVVRRHFKPGEIICREGEYGSTAFYILEGKAKVSIASPIAHVKTRGTIRKFLGKLSSRLTQRQNDARDEEKDQQWIHIDAPLDLSYDNPVATLGPGDLFGEMTCMSLYPRSATIQAETECTMLEMLRNVLDIMQRNKTFPRATRPLLPRARSR